MLEALFDVLLLLQLNREQDPDIIRDADNYEHKYNERQSNIMIVLEAHQIHLL